MRAVRPPRNRERGAIAVLLALLMTVLMGFAALGFDLAYVRLAREEMMNATDAAAHAAGITLSLTNNTGTAQGVAVDIASKNTMLGQPVALDPSDVVFGTYDFSSKAFVAGASPATAVQVTGSKTAAGLVPLTFGRNFGLSTANTTESAMAAYTNRYFQIELQISDDWMCNIDNAADAAVAFLQYLNGTNGLPGDWIGLDLFTGNTKQMTGLMHVRTHYALDILPVWQRDATTLGITQGLWAAPGTTPPAPPQTKGIAVCSKANAPSYNFPGPPTLPYVPGGYRQCPSVSDAGGTLPTDQQFAYPNHSWVQYCSDGGPPGLYAGTDLGAAIRDGTNKLKAAAQPYETKVLILITDGVPMACTGVGGGGLCGHTYGGDKVPPPTGKTSADFWSPCCASGLTCDGWYTVGGTSYGGGIWGDGSSGNSTNGTTACQAAHTLTTNAWTEADNAKAAGVDLFVVGFYKNATDLSAQFAASLIRNRGKASITYDSTKLAGILQGIAASVNVSLVH